MAVKLKSSNALHALHGRDLDPIITDTRLPDGSGINLIKQGKARHLGHRASSQPGTARLAKAAADSAQAAQRLVSESDTGMEIAAQVIHAISHRCELGFVTVSYDAIPEGFLEIDFFGVKTDASPRAIRDRIDFSQAAYGGACFRTSAAQKNQRTEVHSGRFRQYLNCHLPCRHHGPL